MSLVSPNKLNILFRHSLSHRIPRQSEKLLLRRRPLTSSSSVFRGCAFVVDRNPKHNDRFSDGCRTYSTSRFVEFSAKKNGSSNGGSFSCPKKEAGPSATPAPPESSFSISSASILGDNAPAWAVDAHARVQEKRQRGESLTEPPPPGVSKILLHSCCAPCSGAMVEEMLSYPNCSVTVYFYNPNIHPRVRWQ